MKRVLVTGTSSGIGRTAVLALREAGCHVIATARDLGDISDLEGEHVQLMALDVTDPKAITDVAAAVLADGPLDALVNNAGYGAFLPIEETTPEDLRAMFEVNVFGLHALTLAFLGPMREQGRGRIVNVASVAGHLSFPLLGAYCGTKFAVRAMTHALYLETRRFGLHACLIEPGNISTGFGSRAASESQQVEGGPYERLHRVWRRWRDRHEQSGADPAVIARRIVHACTAPRPRFHYFAPLDAKAGNLVSRLVPDRLIHAALRAYYRW